MSKILIIDFGSQYTHLITKNVRKLKAYAEVVVYTKVPEDLTNVKGVILSGSPYSVTNGSFPNVDLDIFGDIPVLGICYGCQMIARQLGEVIVKSSHREFGKHPIILEKDLLGLEKNKIEDETFSIDSIVVWMSHNDTILTDMKIDILARTANDVVAAFKVKDKHIYGLQFHPEVTHTTYGMKMLDGFLDICKIERTYTMKSYIEQTIPEIQEKVKDDNVLMAVSGGVDSSVAAALLHKAIGDKLLCVFIDNGLLRKNEVKSVANILKTFGVKIKQVDASDQFLKNLKGVSNPETKRKVIGKTFIDVFQDIATSLPEEYNWLGQGTIYPDVIESVPGFGLIKSHHNVGGLPEKMNMKLVEPLRLLFKDEVRDLGKELGLSTNIINRHPFPGPGLSIRIIGDVTCEKIKLLQEADNIFIQELYKNNLYDKIWQAGVILLPIKTVGVMGDMRTYEYTVALRAVCSENGMTAKPFNFDGEFLLSISTKIINEVSGINKVVYDISSKPPSTIEWE